MKGKAAADLIKLETLCVCVCRVCVCVHMCVCVCVCVFPAVPSSLGDLMQLMGC